MSEEYEHVPWSELAAEARPDRRRLAYLAAGLLVAVAVGLVGVRTLGAGGGVPVSVTEASLASPPSSLAGASTLPPAGPVAAAQPELFSEADLRAGTGGDGAALAAMRAEWFVVDYFTADRDPRGSLDVRTALPGDASLPALAQDGPVGPLSYVEWARAFRVEDLGGGLHRVAVAFRTVAGPDGALLERLPVRAVEIVVRVGDLGLAVVDLPAPASLPLDVGYAPWPDDGQALPADLARQAITDAEAWGHDAEVTMASRAASGWRVVVSVADEAGVAWPLVLWYDGDAAIATPPWTDR